MEVRNFTERNQMSVSFEYENEELMTLVTINESDGRAAERLKSYWS
jgi:hypothetical protein